MWLWPVTWEGCLNGKPCIDYGSVTPQPPGRAPHKGLQGPLRCPGGEDTPARSQRSAREGGRQPVSDEERDGVALTNLDQPLFDGAGATKRDLVNYLDTVRDLLIAELTGRPLSVIRVRPGQAPFMQKNLPKYVPDW